MPGKKKNRLRKREKAAEKTELDQHRGFGVPSKVAWLGMLVRHAIARASGEE